MAEAKDSATNVGAATNVHHQRIKPNREFWLHIWEALAMANTVFRLRGVMKAGCVVALFVFARVGIARDAETTALHTTAVQAPAPAAGSPAQTATARPTLEKVRTDLPPISYVDGQLRIHALDSTLEDILTKVAAVTGVKIDVPAAANSEHMPIVELGPGPARQILASLLSDSNFDYLIQASDTDPDKIQSVLLMAREKKRSGPNGTDAAARPSRSPYARAVTLAAKPEEAPAPDSPVPAPSETIAEVNPLNPPPASTSPDQATPSADPSMQQPPLTRPDQPNLIRTAPMSPPATLNPQTINQQLQQMYQQRMQILQQERLTPPPGAPTNPGGR